jgi:hypothetical protein
VEDDDMATGKKTPFAPAQAGKPAPPPVYRPRRAPAVLQAKPAWPGRAGPPAGPAPAPAPPPFLARPGRAAAAALAGAAHGGRLVQRAEVMDQVESFDGWTIVVAPPYWDSVKHEHGFNFTTSFQFSGVSDVWVKKNVAFSQTVRSRAKRTGQPVGYFDNWNWHDDGYSVGDFALDGHAADSIKYHVTDTPSFNNTFITLLTNVTFEFEFTQTIVFGDLRYTTRPFSATLAGAGAGTTLNVSLDGGAAHAIAAATTFSMR